MQKTVLNHVFTIENIGNQIQTAEGSVDYGILHLKTPVLLILGHSDCGAIKAALSDFTKRNIRNNQRTILIKKKTISPYHFTDKNKIYRYAQANVDEQVNIALKKYKHKVDTKELIILGIMNDFDTTLPSRQGEIYITNINGNTNIKKMQNNPIAAKAKIKRTLKRLNKNPSHAVFPLPIF